MPDIVITVGPDGKACGLGQEDQAHFRRFVRRLRQMEPGETLVMSWSVPRSPALHRRHFGMLGQIFDNQERFESEEEFRKWSERGARHVDVLEGPNGMRIEQARSISYETLDDDEFRELHQRVRRFLLSEVALHELWPHVSTAVAYDGMLILMEEMGK